MDSTPQIHSPASQATVLVIEDSPIQATLIRRQLEHGGYKVLMAKDGGEGLTLARS
ncbi:MAG: hypothetical protein RLZ63_1493, partial [Pseudomonadota bacterium]